MARVLDKVSAILRMHNLFGGILEPGIRRFSTFDEVMIKDLLPDCDPEAVHRKQPMPA